MEFKQRSLIAIADMICGNFKAEESHFFCRSRSYLTRFFQYVSTAKAALRRVSISTERSFACPIPKL
jgi:hypothetical protein